MIVAGMNGFGRFGLHLLKYWLDRSEQSSFRIEFINDNTLSLASAYEVIVGDPYVKFDDYDVQIGDCALVISKRSGRRHVITYTNKPASEIGWLGRPDVLFECSGKEKVSDMRRSYLCGSTKLVIISATSWDADETLIYGFNQERFSSSHNIVSYGSCTVNAYVPLADFLHGKFGIIDSDVHVVHNTPEYRLADNMTLRRKACTLQVSAGRLLPFVNEDNFLVKYTLVPYSGVSMIDFRFRLESEVSKVNVLAALQEGFSGEELGGLYGLCDFDSGPERFNCSSHSAVFIEDAVKGIGNNLYLQAYCDTENSANRFFDLADCLSTRVDLSEPCCDSVGEVSGGKDRVRDSEEACGRTA